MTALVNFINPNFRVKSVIKKSVVKNQIGFKDRLISNKNIKQLPYKHIPMQVVFDKLQDEFPLQNY